MLDLRFNESPNLNFLSTIKEFGWWDSKGQKQSMILLLLHIW